VVDYGEIKMNPSLFETDFLEACNTRDLGLLTACLVQGLKVNKRLPNGLPPIVVCCQNRFTEAIPLLCEKGAVLDQSAQNTTALLEAVRNNDCTTVGILLTHGANPDLGTKVHLRPLMLAARLGYSECARLLLEFKADVNAFDKYLWTALHEAARSGHVDCIQLLLAHGADPLAGTKEYYGYDHFKSLKGFTPLHLASEAGNAHAVKALLECTPADVATTGRETPLLLAGNVETARLLIAAGANIEAVSRTGVTPLNTAALRGDLNVIRLLLESGANPNISYLDAGPAVVSAVYPTTLPDTKANTELGADPDVPCVDRNASVERSEAFAVPTDTRDKAAIIKLLLEFGADINMPCADSGATALHLALSAKDKKLVTFLLEHGARYGSLWNRRTEVDVARLLGEDELAELILKYGPRMDTPMERN